MSAPIDTRELHGLAFACLPGCGFCCTYPAEVSRSDAARLRARAIPLKLMSDGERSFMQLQGGCGACTFLERRECAVYEARPAHCRYFPFHVYFGETPEAYVNYTCRGVERAEGGDLSGPFRESVLANAKEGEVARRHEEAVGAYAEFRRRARRADVWADPQPAVEEARRDAAGFFEPEGLAGWLSRAQVEATPEDLREDAFDAFDPDLDPTARPYYLTPDLDWWTFTAREPGRLTVVEMSETGDLTERRGIEPDLDAPLPPALRAALAGYFQRLLDRGVFRGQAYDLVDESRYTLGVEAAVARRAVEVAVDLTARAAVLAALHGALPPARLAEEVARFYDSEFLDAPTIGGFL